MFNAETIFISEIDKDLFFCLHDRDFDRIPESTAARLMEKRIIVDDSSRDLYFLNSKTQSLQEVVRYPHAVTYNRPHHRVQFRMSLLLPNQKRT